MQVETRCTRQINSELDISPIIMFRMLMALDDDLDEATERMNFVMGRLGKLLKTKSESVVW